MSVGIGFKFYTHGFWTYTYGFLPSLNVGFLVVSSLFKFDVMYKNKISVDVMGFSGKIEDSIY
jgi:hypothetical protein